MNRLRCLYLEVIKYNTLKVKKKKQKNLQPIQVSLPWLVFSSFLVSGSLTFGQIESAT